MTAPATSYRRHVRAVRNGPWVTLHVPWTPEASTIAIDLDAPPLDRYLAGLATGELQAHVVEAAIRTSDILRAEVAALAAQPLPPIIERHIVTLIVNVGGGPR